MKKSRILRDILNFSQLLANGVVIAGVVLALSNYKAALSYFESKKIELLMHIPILTFVEAGGDLIVRPTFINNNKYEVFRCDLKFANEKGEYVVSVDLSGEKNRITWQEFCEMIEKLKLLDSKGKHIIKIKAKLLTRYGIVGGVFSNYIMEVEVENGEPSFKCLYYDLM